MGLVAPLPREAALLGGSPTQPPSPRHQVGPPRLRAGGEHSSWWMWEAGRREDLEGCPPITSTLVVALVWVPPAGTLRE